MSKDGESGEDEKGSGLAATLGGAVALVAIVVLGVWLANELAESVRYQKCAAARHRNCDTIDYRTPPPQQ